ncbi:MAG: DNA-protecting protein DprA [Rickettsiales bacterium]|nr:DNA-protecting protein DprA [Rickettsiales bacterium]
MTKLPENLYALAVSQTPKVGPITYLSLISSCGSAIKAYEYILDDPKYKIKPNLGEAERKIEKALKQGVTILSLGDPKYPQTLADIKDPPPVLFVKGNLALLERPNTAIVGARYASIAGQKIAYSIAKHLSGSGFTIVSGFARGIDLAAHKGAQENGSIAVFAGGIDQIFPLEHAPYVSKFLETGLIVSEMPIGHKPIQQNFPRRNRIISGLSRMVIVIEAASQSGSLLTATYALEQGREVAAVPGCPLDPRCKGSNKLLKDGAHFIENAWDVMGLLSSNLGISKQAEKKDVGESKLMHSNNDLEGAITSLLGYSPVDLNELINQLPAQPDEVLRELSKLELSGKVVRGRGNEVSLKPVE